MVNENGKFAISWFVSSGFSRFRNQSRERWFFAHNKPRAKTTRNTKPTAPLAFPHTVDTSDTPLQQLRARLNTLRRPEPRGALCEPAPEPICTPLPRLLSEPAPMLDTPLQQPAAPNDLLPVGAHSHRCRAQPVHLPMVHLPLPGVTSMQLRIASDLCA